MSSPSSTPKLTEPDFARLFHQHARPLWCVAVAVLGRREGAEDILQESAITGLQKRSEFSPGTSFIHWMGQIVRYTALNEGRRRRLRNAASVDSIGEPRDRSLPPTASEEPFDDQTLAALATLEDTARMCLLMRTVLDMSYRQIAEALHLAEGTAMSHVHRSRQRMRAALLAAERAHTPAHPASHPSGRKEGR
jgi:RNA polymerase sigma-70 factor, ECF subfamily